MTASFAGNEQVTDQLLNLYLSGRKTAASSLVKDYQRSGESLPKVDDHWIILDSQKNPRCIAKTVKVLTYQFSRVPEEVVRAEGEGDLSVSYWKKAHEKFFAPFLKDFGIDDINTADVITEFYEIVFKKR